MWTESEYESWFEKYLGDVESLDSVNKKSCLLNIPKPFKKKRWLYTNILLFITTLIISYTLAFIFEYLKIWYIGWASSAFLNLSLGLVASFMIFTYTNHRDRNIAFYTDVLPLLRKRYKNMHTAYFDFFFKISIAHQKQDYEALYEAWDINSNTCFVIIQFFEFLIEIFPFEPKSFKGITVEKLKEKKNEIMEINREVQDEYYKRNKISDDLVVRCNKANNIGGFLLMSLNELIEELEQDYFSIKYTNRKITSIEKEEIDFKKEYFKQ